MPSEEARRWLAELQSAISALYCKVHGMQAALESVIGIGPSFTFLSSSAAALPDHLFKPVLLSSITDQHEVQTVFGLAPCCCRSPS